YFWGLREGILPSAPPPRCLSPRPVTPILLSCPLAPVPRSLLIGDRMHMVAADRLIGPLHACPWRLPGRLPRDEVGAAVADQVRPPGLFQGLSHLEVVLRLENCKRARCNLRSRSAFATYTCCFVNGSRPV